MVRGTPPPGCNRPWTCRAESPRLLWPSPGRPTYPTAGGGGRHNTHVAEALTRTTVEPFTYLGFEVDVGGGHFGNLEDADGQRDGTQHKQTVVDQDPSQHRMSDPTVAADTEV